ncbi:MAG: PorP/SprF family type IX secretion system membrane protein [Bacteroidetes bacterium]|nr:PorP/SprF family type IX secretion system membrane protein [Bacteroidota bacterium]
MKKIAATALILFSLFSHISAQQTPIYSQIYFMRMLYNPALTAYNGTTNIYGFYREQWTGMPGHPVTRGAVGDISLWEDRIGTGIHVYNDNTDIIKRINVQAYYAQKITFAKDHRLSLGFSAGVQEVHVDFANARATDADDPNLLAASKGGVAFDLNVGLAYQWKKLTIGVAVPQVLNTKANITSGLKDSRFKNVRYFNFSASYEISLKNETWNIEPAVIAKYALKKTYQIEGNIMANYKRIGYLGVGYRMDYGMSFIAAARISKAVTIGYSYEYPLMGKVKYADTKGTHEVIVGVHFNQWMNKKEKEEVNPKLDLIDSLLIAQEEMKKSLDSAWQAIDSLEFAKMEQEQKIAEQYEKLLDQDEKNQELTGQLNKVQSEMNEKLDNAVKDYQQMTKDKPLVDFPATVDKSTKSTKGSIYRLNKVEFDKNSSYMNRASYTELDKVAEFMTLNPNTNIRINGHTDNIANANYNQWLSDRRAKRVYDYLLEKGLPADRMTYFGFGLRAPIADNNTEQGRALNRRVEIEITK